jgi:hypothetical protein
MTPIPFNHKIDEMLEKAGGKLYLATLDRPALERFVRAILSDIEGDLIEWRDAKDETMSNDKYWDGYEQGMVDAIVAVKTWGQIVD